MTDNRMADDRIVNRVDAESKEKAVCIASIIKNLKDIDMDSECGKLLLMGLAKITTESQTNKTPQEVLDQLNDLREEVFGIPKEYSNKVCNK